MQASPREVPTVSPTEEPFVKVDSVSLGYGDHVAVQDLSLAVGDGEFVAIIGPSGCGKSTLLHLLAGLQRPLGGSVHLSGRRVTGALATEIRIGYVFQDHRLLPWRTVAQNIVLAMKNAGVPRSEWNDRIDRYLSMLEVSNYRDSWPLKLSGGQRQRVSIARALAIDPALILMDEPFSGLDEVTGRTLRQGLVRLWQDTKVPIVFVTHSIREALFLADRVVVLSRGPARLLREFPVELPRPRVYEDPELAKLESAVVSEVIEEWGLEGPGRDSDGRAGGPA